MLMFGIGHRPGKRFKFIRFNIRVGGLIPALSIKPLIFEIGLSFF